MQHSALTPCQQEQGGMEKTPCVGASKDACESSLTFSVNPNYSGLAGVGTKLCDLTGMHCLHFRMARKCSHFGRWCEHFEPIAKHSA